MPGLAVTLFGGFEIRGADGAIRDAPGQKERALLAVLALSPGGARSRDQLAGLLWSDRGDAQARDSLKHALARLRQCFAPDGGAVILADRQAVRLDASATVIDVSQFEALLRDGTSEAAERAIALYRGDLLEGTLVRDPAFEDWLRVEQRRLRNLVEEAAGRLLADALTSGDRERAADAARRLLAFDPLREDACRALMQIHGDRGETARAFKLFTDLRDQLRRALGVTPEPETERLYEAIRRGRATEKPAELTEPTGPALPDRPSIAVLAFQNLSGDPDQEYFADGIVEEIITALSRMRWLFVIARSSSFTFKGKAVDVKQVGRDLGVRYVLEGSLRRSAKRVRINAHLIDAGMGTHLWADSFEGEITEIFDLQDQVTARVVGALAPRLEQAEIERSKRKPTNLDAYDYFLRGMAAVHQWTRPANLEALAMFAKAIERDPVFAAAYGFAARCYSQRKACGWVTDAWHDVAEVRRLASHAVEFGPDDAVALSTAGIALAFVAGEPSEGGALLKRALELNPNLAMTWLFSGWASVWNGEPAAALEKLATAMRLSPYDPQFAMMQGATACAHFFAGRTDEAIHWAESALSLQPEYRIAACVLAASRALDGEPDKAQRAVAHLRALDPSLRVSNLLASFPIKRPEDIARWADGLRRAGLPE